MDDEHDGDVEFIPANIWARPPAADAIHYTIVCVPDVGTIAEATLPDGHRFYGVDSPPVPHPDPIGPGRS